MPNVELSNDEYHRLMTERTNATLTNGHCEDYPCCGHTPDDPCTREWYDHPDAFNPLVNPHCFCEHEYGICDVEPYPDDPDPDDCEHGEAYYHGARITCDLCGTPLMIVTDTTPYAYPSTIIPGLMVEITIIGTHMEARQS